MYAILKATRERLGFSPELVEDICMGNVRRFCQLRLAYQRERPRLLTRFTFLTGFRWQSSLQGPCRGACRWVSQLDRRELRKPILLLGPQGHG